MKIISEQIIGDLTVISNGQYNNIIGENVIVAENIMTRFYGIINKNLTIKKGATVYLHGNFFGKLINEGGILYVFDTNGKVSTFTDNL
jgi:membrane protease subunit (stomatin/prohibitin family)